MLVRLRPLVVAVVFVAGCEKVPTVGLVSGVIKLDGKPLVGATIAFAPIAPEGSIVAGDASSGKTNENGEYTLTTVRGVPGAAVAMHRVRVSMPRQVWTSDLPPPPGALKDVIPSKYNGETTLTFKVEPGQNKADFDLSTH
jgi:hypothetical protein